MKQTLKFLPAAILVVLAGCTAPTDERAGRGPLTLSPDMQKNISKYLRKDSPGAFAIAQNGAWGGSFCQYHCVQYDARKSAVDSCEKNSKGSPCFLYAIGNQIVWKGNVTKNTGLPIAKQATAKTTNRSFDGKASIYPANAKAEEVGAFSIPYKDIGRSGSLNFSFSNGESFTGSYTSTGTLVSSGQWGKVYSLLDEGETSVQAGQLPGRLDAFGSRGTSIQCEYAVDRQTRAGIGVCKANTGALYRLHFSVNH